MSTEMYHRVITGSTVYIPLDIYQKIPKLIQAQASQALFIVQPYKLWANFLRVGTRGET